MHEVYVGVGSNIDPSEHLLRAAADLTREFGRLRCSRVYRSPAHGFDGPDFLNMVVAFEAGAGPAEVERSLTRIERAGGRDGCSRAGSRTLDLDLLQYGHRVNAVERLPRDDILRYPFVLAPLNELAPSLRHPVTGTPVAEAWRAMASSGPALAMVGVLDSIRAG